MDRQYSPENVVAAVKRQPLGGPPGKAMEKILAITWFTGLIAFLGCSRVPATPDLQGKWIADNASLYLDIHGDSLSYVGNAIPFSNEHRHQDSILTYQDLGPGPASFKPPSPFRHFTIGPHGELAVYAENKMLDTLGILTLSHNSISIRETSDREAVRLLPMISDATIHLKKIQFSATSCLGPCPVYDLELAPASIIVVEPRGQWITGFPIRRETFQTAIPPATFFACEAIIRRARIREAKTRFEKGVVLENDIPAYGLAIYYNDTVATILGDAFHFPPELAPLIPYLKDPRDRYTLVTKDTSILFLSRLRVLTNMNDSLTYLEGVDRNRYRAARFRGGDDGFQRYVRQALGPYAKRHGTYCFNVVIGEDGFVKQVIEDRNASLGDLLPIFQKILQRSPRWQAPLYEGHPTRVREYVCFYNEGP
jgi:hypothetical protein